MTDSYDSGSLRCQPHGLKHAVHVDQSYAATPSVQRLCYNVVFWRSVCDEVLALLWRQSLALRNLELKALYEVREEQEQFLPRQLLPQTTPAT